MKKKLVVFFTVALVLCCALALAVSAECAHVADYEIKTGDNGVYDEWEAISICTECGVVIADEFYSPVITSLGYSYFEGSFVQGFVLDANAKAKYEEYTGNTIEYGIVAGVTSVVGNAPVDGEGNVTTEKAITYDLTQNNLDRFDIKIVNIPAERYGEKIIACAYAIENGKVTYSDNGNADTQVCGISVNEVVNLLENGIPAAGLYEMRELTPEEMDILFACYWKSDEKIEFNIRRTTDNTPRKFASTRMFSRSELPAGSEITVKSGWTVRPEIWKINEEGDVVKNGSRPYSTGLEGGTYTVESLWKDTVADDGTVTKRSDYEYMAFNISEKNGAYAEMMGADGIAQVLKIFVPYTTKVEKKADETENISVKGKTLKEWTTDTLLAGKYRNNQNSASNTGSDSQYYTTELFTKETLPVGSVIEINEGWWCRIEYWNANGSKAGNRGPMCGTYRLVITEEFWEGYSYRSLNISTVNKDKLSTGDWDKVASAIRIYVPTK